MCKVTIHSRSEGGLEGLYIHKTEKLQVGLKSSLQVRFKADRLVPNGSANSSYILDIDTSSIRSRSGDHERGCYCWRKRTGTVGYGGFLAVERQFFPVSSSGAPIGVVWDSCLATPAYWVGLKSFSFLGF